VNATFQSTTVPLGDVATFIRGINFKPDDVVPVETDGAVACMRTKNVQVELDQSDVWFVSRKFVRRSEQMLAPGDLLISSANSWNLVGKCCWIPQLPWESSFGGFVCALRAKPEKLDARYLYHWFSSPRIQSTLRSFGRQTTNISNLDINRCEKLSIPLPPLSEQKRIAEILDRAESLRRQRRAALALLDELTQSIFLDMFGDPVSNPMGWDSCELSEICEEISDINHKMPKAVANGVPFISAKDLTNDGRLSFDDVKYVSQTDFEDYSRKSCPRKGDIIYSRIGVNLGKARIVEVNFPFLVSYSCCIIRPIVSKVGLSFLCHLMDSPFMLKQAHRGVRAIAVPDLGLGEIKRFKVILPPMKLQQDFEDCIGRLEAIKTLHRAGLAQLNQLFASLQHRAFRGEL
jgi:type I restriction enzyme, S subunit